MDNDMRKEISAIWDKIGAIEKTLSQFVDICHGASTDGIGENSEGLMDVATLSDENSEGLMEVAEMVADLEERLTTLEGGN